MREPISTFSMELLRYSHNAWGQATLEGVSWDLLPVFFGLAVAFIIVHALFAHFLSPKDKN